MNAESRERRNETSLRVARRLAQLYFPTPMTTTDFTIGDLVMIDAGTIESLARVRSCSQERVHIALEQGQFLPWTDAPVSVRRCNDLMARAHAARVVHASGVTATLEIIPEANDTERDVSRPALV
jgi:hypothetical protein